MPHTQNDQFIDSFINTIINEIRITPRDDLPHTLDRLPPSKVGE
jgi:hypothetical protein